MRRLVARALAADHLTDGTRTLVRELASAVSVLLEQENCCEGDERRHREALAQSADHMAKLGAHYARARRDRFAAAALTGILSDEFGSGDERDAKNVALVAAAYADALLSELDVEERAARGDGGAS